jgi:predicted ribosome quality control (RQC) complex YloA/Tae2 family protein
MKNILIFLVLFAFILPVDAATIYKWVDKKGVVNFTDDYEKVPPLYRNQVQEEGKEEVKKMPPPPTSPQPLPLKEEEIGKDIYGRDETWWQDRVLPWKERLKEATENLERVSKEFADKTVEMGRKGLVSRARHQTEANKYNEEKKKYEAQITEAKEMLEKFSKEAEESKANPDWLK